MRIHKDRQFYKFCMYGFLKNMRFFEIFFILFLRDAGMSFTSIGILYSLREITANIMEIPTGVIADTFGRKQSLIASFWMYIFSFLLFYFSGGFWGFVAAFILYGVGEAFRSGTHKAIIMQYLQTQGMSDLKSWYYGHTRSCSQTGSAVSALLGAAFVFFNGDYRSVFLFSIVPYLIDVMVVSSYPDEKRLNNGKRHRVSLRNGFQSLIRVIRIPKVIKIMGDSALHTAYLKAVKDYIQPLLVHISFLIPFTMAMEKKKKESVVIGVVYMFIYLLTSRASRYAAAFERKGKERANYLSLLAGVISGLITGLFYDNRMWFFALITFTAIYLVENIRKPIMTGYISDHVPNEILASVISAQSLLKTVLTSVIALSIGILSDYYGFGVGLTAVSAALLILVFIIRILPGATSENGIK